KQPSACKCGSKKLEQDSDVLDTWFSSCLWPFASLGWPDKTAELKYYFPTSVLITGHDIIFFWVARMIMMSLYFMKDVPFGEVFINPLVNDMYGQKMSKSKGNVIDPIEIIEKNGSDALRYTLASLTTPGKNLLLGEEKIEGSRNFANKLWNASKFVIFSLENSEFLKKPEIIKNIKPDSLSFNLWDKWILSRFTGAVKSVNNYLEKYSFSFACRMLTDFFWNDFCDWYIESSKVRLYSKNDGKDMLLKEKENKVKSHKTSTRIGGTDNGITAVYVLWYILEQYLRLLHPFMPFITEKIWQIIPHTGCSIMIEPFPALKDVLPGRFDPDAEAKISKICSIIGEIRKIRSELRINPALRIEVYLKPSSSDIGKLIEENSKYIIELARLDKLNIFEPPDKKGFISSVKNNNEIYILLKDVIDLQRELERINNEIAKINTDREKSYKKLTNPQFLEKAPKKIIQKEEAKLKQADKSLKVLSGQLEKLKSII
ncbi:MAG: class I tRNA ligase family protein, partial [Actinobacteria bacterium]|nr:class I tRNA ligase family protein [Actinomycetota bacterium]